MVVADSVWGVVVDFVVFVLVGEGLLVYEDYCFGVGLWGYFYFFEGPEVGFVGGGVWGGVFVVGWVGWSFELVDSHFGLWWV